MSLTILPRHKTRAKMLATVLLTTTAVLGAGHFRAGYQAIGHRAQHGPQLA